jgi:hypothetical protein
MDIIICTSKIVVYHFLGKFRFDFVKWFNLSEYSKKFMYEADVIKEVFEESLEDGKASPKEWDDLFKKYAKKQDSESGLTQYR